MRHTPPKLGTQVDELHLIIFRSVDAVRIVVIYFLRRSACITQRLRHRADDGRAIRIRSRAVIRVR